MRNLMLLSISMSIAITDQVRFALQDVERAIMVWWPEP